MKVYTKIILDKNNKVIYEDSYEYKGKWARLGIHYSYKNTRSSKAMAKQAKREKKLAERRAKREAKLGSKKKEEPSSKINPDEPLNLDFITNPNRDKWILIKKKGFPSLRLP